MNQNRVEGHKLFIPDLKRNCVQIKGATDLKLSHRDEGIENRQRVFSNRKNDFETVSSTIRKPRTSLTLLQPTIYFTLACMTGTYRRVNANQVKG